MLEFKNAFVVTGSIGSGKSTFVDMLKERGFSVIDADKISHLELENSKDEVINKFGIKILNNGKIDRKKLGEVVFNDKNELKWLENLLHPKIQSTINLKCRELESLNKPYFVDIPLFYEGLTRYKFNKIVVVYAPKDILIERVMKRNLLDFNSAKNRVELQIDIEQKRKNADFVIDNTKDLEHLKEKTDEFLNQISQGSQNANLKI